MLLEGKKALIIGVANKRSIAYGISEQFKKYGAELAFTYVNDAIQKRVDPISEELGGAFTTQLDVADDASIASAVAEVEEKWGKFDILVHAVAFANRDELKGRYLDTSRDGFHLAMDVSAYSLVAVTKAFEKLLNPDASVMTLTYLGSVQVIDSYNVMGVAKAALEASVRYMAHDLGRDSIRVNAISAGPLKTLAASGVSGLKGLFNVIEERSPMRQNITQNDVGRTAVYLASELSRGVTGEIIYVDSGYNIMGV